MTKRTSKISIAERGLRDFRYFAKELCNVRFFDWKTTHGPMADFMCGGKLNKAGKVQQFIGAPRDSGKSILFATHAAWNIVRSAANWGKWKKGTVRVLYASHSTANARATGSVILSWLTESAITDVYGSFESDILWGSEQFIIRQRKEYRKEANFSIGSVKKSTTGGHYDLVYADDAQVDENARTKTSRQKVFRYLRELDNQADQHTKGEYRVCGTFWWEDDAYMSMLNQDDEGLWERFVTNVEEGNWPGFTEEFLQAKLKNIGPYLYAANFLLKPWVAVVNPFRAEDIKPIAYKDIPKGVVIYALFDAASSEGEDSARNAIWIIAVDSTGDLYLLDLFYEKALPDTVADRMASMQRKWNPRWTAMEAGPLYGTYKTIFRMKREQTGAPIKLVRARVPSGPKEIRLLNFLQPRLHNSTIHFCVDKLPNKFFTYSDTSGPSGILTSELLHFPKIEFLDAWDALSLADATDKHGASVCPRNMGKRLNVRPPGVNPWRFGPNNRAGFLYSNRGNLKRKE